MAEITSTTKTFVLGADGVTYSEVTRVTYDDTSYNETSRPVGPAAALTADQADKILATMSALAVASREISRAKQVIADANTQSASIQSITGQSPLLLIQSRKEAELFASGWTIDIGAGFVPLVFSKNAQGVLKYSISGAATKNADCRGDVIRLNNYPDTSTNTDFFLDDSGRKYNSLPNRKETIKKP